MKRCVFGGRSEEHPVLVPESVSISGLLCQKTSNLQTEKEQGNTEYCLLFQNRSFSDRSFTLEYYTC